MKFVIFVPLIFSKCESTFVLTEARASIFDRKTAARPFDTNHDILWSLSLVQSLLKGAKSPNLQVGTQGLSGFVTCNWGFISF